MNVAELQIVYVQLKIKKCHLQAIGGPFYKHGLTLLPAWISNHMPSEITYPFLNCNGCTVEV